MADKKTKEAAAQYTKAQLLSSKRYTNRRDLINALLVDNETYTTDTVDVQIEKYLKGSVK